MTKRKFQTTAAYLDIHSWRGISFGAIHYYGKLIFRSKEEEVLRVVTQELAQELNKWDRYASYQAGDKTNRFDTEEAIRTVAIQMFQKHMVPRGAVVLIEGRSGVVQPQPIIAHVGFDREVQAINRLFRRVEKLGGWGRGHDTAMQKIENQWDKLAEKIGIWKFKEES